MWVPFYMTFGKLLQTQICARARRFPFPGFT
jgi:hypothetical protein